MDTTKCWIYSVRLTDRIVPPLYSDKWTDEKMEEKMCYRWPILFRGTISRQNYSFNTTNVFLCGYTDEKNKSLLIIKVTVLGRKTSDLTLISGNYHSSRAYQYCHTCLAPYLTTLEIKDVIFRPRFSVPYPDNLSVQTNTFYWSTPLNRNREHGGNGPCRETFIMLKSSFVFYFPVWNWKTNC